MHLNNGFIVKKKGAPPPTAARHIAGTILYKKIIELSENLDRLSDQDSDETTINDRGFGKTKT